MGKKYDGTIARIREIRKAIPKSADGLVIGTSREARAKVSMDGVAAGVVIDALLEAIDGNMADEDADKVADAIVGAVTVASSLGMLALV